MTDTPDTGYVSTLTLDRSAMKQNDTSPAMTIKLADSDGPMDLTIVTTISLIFKGNTTSTLVTSVCTAENAHAGEALYTISSGDWATVDTYQAECELVSSGELKQTVSSAYEQNPTLRIDQQLDAPTG